MRKILIVDDDRLILEDICKLIHWESCGFQTPVTAESAGEALSVMGSRRIDLVITDISMPEISGVELIRQAKNRFPYTMFAVLSNYDDFIYVKEAMKAGAVEYLLKYEIEPNNLKEFMLQMSRKIDAEKKSESERKKIIRMHQDVQLDLRSHFLRLICRGNIEEGHLYEQANRLGIPVKGGVWVPVHAEFARQEGAKDIESLWAEIEAAVTLSAGSMKIYGTLTEDKMLFLILFIPEVSFLLLNTMLATILKQLQERFECADIAAFLYAGRICVRFRELTEAMGRMQNYRHLRFYMGYGVVQAGLETEIDTGEFPNKEWLEVLSIMDMGGSAELQESFSGFENTLLKKHPEESVMKQSILNSLRERMTDEEAYRRMELLRQSETCDSLLNCLYELVTEYSQVNRELNKIKRREIREALQYLYQHYDKAITLNQLADKACMSRAYFCKVFKDEAGKTYTDFLNQIRISRACYLLHNSSLHTREVAGLVGLSDYRYFCRLFKSLTGNTCSEFRRQQFGKKKDGKGAGENA